MKINLTGKLIVEGYYSEYADYFGWTHEGLEEDDLIKYVIDLDKGVMDIYVYRNGRWVPYVYEGVEYTNIRDEDTIKTHLREFLKLLSESEEVEF